MRRLRLIAPIAALIVALVFAVAAWRTDLFGAGRSPPDASSPAVAIGGPFHLTDTSGRRVNDSLLRGKWTAVFFGYTDCPDVCPTTLFNLAQAITALGPKAATVQVVFISIDPARDTPAQLAAFLGNPAFPKGAIGLTGSAADIAAVARAYHVYYRKAGDGPAYTMDHTSIVYLMNPDGVFVKPLTFDAPPTAMAAQISQAMEGHG